MCDEYKDTKENKDLLKEYKSRCILRERIAELPSFSKDITISLNAAETKRDVLVCNSLIAADSFKSSATGRKCYLSTKST